MRQQSQINSVPADPSKWSEKSQHSVSFHWVKEYIDIAYNCWGCKKATVSALLIRSTPTKLKKLPLISGESYAPNAGENCMKLTEILSSASSNGQNRRIHFDQMPNSSQSGWICLLPAKRRCHIIRIRQPRTCC